MHGLQLYIYTECHRLREEVAVSKETTPTSLIIAIMRSNQALLLIAALAGFCASAPICESISVTIQEVADDDGKPLSVAAPLQSAHLTILATAFA